LRIAHRAVTEFMPAAIQNFEKLLRAEKYDGIGRQSERLVASPGNPMIGGRHLDVPIE
jgi:hypothetical protein